MLDNNIGNNIYYINHPKTLYWYSDSQYLVTIVYKNEFSITMIN